MFDGQRKTLEANYDDQGKRIKDVQNLVPRQVLPYALNQTIIMGSEDLRNPGSFKSLVGVPTETKKSWGDCSYCEQSDEVTRVPANVLMEDDPSIIRIITKGRKEHNSFDAMEGMAGVTTPFEVRSQV